MALCYDLLESIFDKSDFLSQLRFQQINGVYSNIDMPQFYDIDIASRQLRPGTILGEMNADDDGMIPLCEYTIFIYRVFRTRPAFDTDHLRNMRKIKHGNVNDVQLT